MSYCELPAFYECYDRVARKEHRCCECMAPIERGEKYVVATGKWNGEVSTYKQHLLCANACRFARNKLMDGDCICFGGLWEWHYETRRWDQDRTHEAWRTFRKMLADIKRRERRSPRPLAPSPENA